jgi:hypothetical protein
MMYERVPPSTSIVSLVSPTLLPKPPSPLKKPRHISGKQTDSP